MNFNVDVIYRKKRVGSTIITIADDVHGRLMLDSGKEVGLEFRLTPAESEKLTYLLNDAAKRAVLEIAKQ